MDLQAKLGNDREDNRTDNLTQQLTERFLELVSPDENHSIAHNEMYPTPSMNATSKNSENNPQITELIAVNPSNDIQTQQLRGQFMKIIKEGDDCNINITTTPDCNHIRQKKHLKAIT